MIEVREYVGGEGSTACFDVCVIGGGIAGWVLALGTAQLGLRTLIVEAGGEGEDFFEEGRDVVFGLRAYRGATRGRVRGVGGTGVRWGGAIIPYLREDFEERKWVGARGWAVSFDEVNRWWRAVEELFGTDDSGYDLHEGDLTRTQSGCQGEEPSFLLRLAKWPYFRDRNVGAMILRKFRHRIDLLVWYRCRVVGFEFSRESGAVKMAKVINRAGEVGVIRSEWFVIAAGAIESTRLALLLDREVGGLLSKCSGVLGRGLVDHLSARVGLIEASKKRELNAALGLRFEKRNIRSIRFELVPKLQREHELPSCWAHISPSSVEGEALTVIRDLGRAVQRGNIAAWELWVGAARDLGGLIRLAHWRFFKNRLRWPDRCNVEIHMVIEQPWREENRIDLDEGVDEAGIPRAKIIWDVSSKEVEQMAQAARLFERWWRNNLFGKYGRVVLDENASKSELGANLNDIFHPCGTTRMGTSRSGAVVDPDLVVWGFKNISIVRTSVFPAVGGANPTGTLMALAFRHAAFLRSRMKVDDVWQVEG